jgi:hypothetical protein
MDLSDAKFFTMSMSLLQRDISEGMARLCQEMRKDMVEITTQAAEDEELHATDTLNLSDDEKTIADPDEWSHENKPLIKSVFEVESTEPQQSLEELKKAKIKEIKERRIKLKVFRGELEILASQVIEFRRLVQLMCLRLCDVEPHLIKAQELINEMTREVNNLDLPVFEQKPMIPTQKLEHMAKLQDTP